MVPKSGQQEDAEEFLGFFLDTIEEEILELIGTIRPEQVQNKNLIKEVETTTTGEEEIGWTEVGKHNRKVVTRSVRTPPYTSANANRLDNRSGPIG
jgi:ubiquitin carboxyl-terminal hydrolase 10